MVTQKESQPFIYNASSQVMISYDDATSFGTIYPQYLFFHDTNCFWSAVKGKFITANGLKGYNLWHIAGDSNDILVDSINSAMGFVPNSAT